MIHHSVINAGDDVATMLEVQNAHRIDRGWADVGYHYLIGGAGGVFQGRDVHVRGTHVRAYNTGSLGLCLLGDFTVDSPTPAQIDSARDLIAWLAVQLAPTHLAAHGDFNSDTLCPGDNLRVWLPELAAAGGLIVGTDGYLPPDDQAALSGSAALPGDALCACCARV